MFMKNSAAGIVEAGPQPGSFGLGEPGLENVAVVKERETVRFMEEKKKRLGRNQRESEED